jgi:chemotaxis protein methyltransferase CheR
MTSAPGSNRPIVRSALEILKALPVIGRAWSSNASQVLRHGIRQHIESRHPYTFTRFFRNPTQLDALLGPVLDFLRPANAAEHLRIVVHGCSTGAEPYTIAATLLARRAGLSFSVEAYDIDELLLNKARLARYDRDEVDNHPFIRPEHVEWTFEQGDGDFTVRPEVRARVSFARADILDPGLPDRMPAAEVLFAQNIFVNMRRGRAKAGFRNVCRLLAPRAVLFVDGMDVDLRARLALEAGLVPLDFGVEAIHNESHDVRGSLYPSTAMGLEPFDPRRKDYVRRYATIFMRG